MNFLDSFVQSLIIANATQRLERKVVRHKKELERHPEKIPVKERLFPQLPEIRKTLPFPKKVVSTTRLVKQEKVEQIPKPSAVAPVSAPVPTPSAPAPIQRQQVPAPRPMQPAHMQQTPQQRMQVPGGYQKIGFDVPEEAGLSEPAPAPAKPRLQQPKPQLQARQQPQQSMRIEAHPALQGMPKPIKGAAKAKTKITNPELKASLGELGNLLEDPHVHSIEYKEGKLKLISENEEVDHGEFSEDEAKHVVEVFAKVANKPLESPFEATIEGLKISAVISEVLGTRFVIEKI